MIVHSTSIVIINCLFFECLIGYNTHTEDIHVYEGSDFSEVTKVSLFVDKTLLIKQIWNSLHHGDGILILEPRRFGKSTNMDMLRRFFHISINKSGHINDPENTMNYDLFRNNYLEIYKDSNFFNKHFGRHPVILIDYGPLGKVTTVEQMLAILIRKIMIKTFSQHKYLLHDSFLWSMNDTFGWIRKDQFTQYLYSELNYKLSEADVQTGFSFLTRLLHKRFEQRVTVLIDNYDALMESILFVQNPDVHHLISAINSDLLRSDSVERSVITGRAESTLLPSNIRVSTADDQIWEYFGLNSEELDSLLQPIIPEYEQRRQVIGRIVHNYNEHGKVKVDGCDKLLDTQVCSVWSVMKYMEEEMAVNDNSAIGQN